MEIQKKINLNQNALVLKYLKGAFIKSIAAATIVAVVAFLLFTGIYLASSMSKGLISSKERLGADITIIPKEKEAAFKALLLQGEPSYFYLKRAYADSVKHIQGVKLVTTQFYLTSLSASCCDFPIQLIGIDTETDFIVKPWIGKVYDDLKGYAIIVGKFVRNTNGTVKLFNQDYSVKAHLSQSGTGLDAAAFVPYEALSKMWENASKNGFGFIPGLDEGPEKFVSTIFVKIEEGVHIDSVAEKIQEALPDVQVIKADKVLANVGKAYEGFSAFVSVFEILSVIIAFIILFVVFSLASINLRRELSIMRLLGASKRYIFSFLLKKAFIESFLGGTFGVALSVIILLPFNTAIADAFSMPYLQPEAFQTVLMIAFVIVSSVLIGLLAAFIPAKRASVQEVYTVLKEN